MTVADISVPSLRPPATTLAPLPMASSISAWMRAAASVPISDPSGVLPLRGIAGDQRSGFGREFCHESVGNLLVHDDPLGRHADLALVHECAEGRSGDRCVEVGIVEHDHRRLAAKFEQNGFQMFRCDLRDDPADAGRAGEIDPAHGGMRDQRFDRLGGILGRIGHDVDDARRKAGVAQAVGDQPMRAGADFRGLQNDRVAAGERQRDGAHAEDDRRVPRRHAQHDAGGLANCHRDAARLVGGDHFAGDLRGHASRFTQHAGGKVDVEAGPAGGRAGFGCHQLDELRCLRRQQIGGFQQDRAPGIRAGGGPGREGGCGGVGRALRIRDLGCRGAACDVAGDGVEAIERSRRSTPEHPCFRAAARFRAWLSPLGSGVTMVR